MIPLTSPARLGVLIYEGVEPIDLGGTVGVVSMASRVLPHVRATVIAHHAGPMRLAGGLTVLAEHGFDNAPPCDVVIVCGGPGWPEAAADMALLNFLRGLPPERLASVCTGALILAAAGVLDGRSATTRRRALGQETVAPLDPAPPPRAGARWDRRRWLRWTVWPRAARSGPKWPPSWMTPW